VTFDFPIDPEAGFLPPNVTPPLGEGFVSYRIKPKSGLPMGTRLDAEASIIFDNNDPLDTPATTRSTPARRPAAFSPCQPRRRPTVLP
jgi:hypothetical protein